MTTKPHFLIVEGYPLEARNVLQQDAASVASELYSRVLQQSATVTLSDDISIEVIYAADTDCQLPSIAELKQYHGVVWTGSNLTIYEQVPEVLQQIELCQRAFAAGVPQFGSCWAAQIAVTAAGGKCAPHPKGIEFGIARSIGLTDDGRAHSMYQGKKAIFDAFISHYDEITHLPPGAQILAANDYTRVQAISVNHQNGSFWSPQYHPEYDLHELARLCYSRRQRLTDLGFFSDVREAELFVENLETLHDNPARKDIAWRLGISADLTCAHIRQAELRNWLTHQIHPQLLG